MQRPGVLIMLLYLIFMNHVSVGFGCILLLLSMVCSCQAGKNTGQQKQQSHNLPSAGWKGSYEGILPCADCSCMATLIELNPDQTFMRWQKHTVEQAATSYSHGHFSWDKAKHTVLLTDENGRTSQYRVANDKLSLLDSTGKIVTGTNAAPFVLHRKDDGIIEKYWKLIALPGQPVIMGESREPHLILKSAGAIWIGHGGCNQLSGQYELKNDQLRFQQITSTELRCTEMSTETAFYKAISGTAYYVFTGDTLTFLNVGKKPLAKFVVVYLH